jgi:hypothetical protein
MDARVKVEVLQKHTEYVGNLVTQLTGTLTQLAHVLNTPQSPPNAQTAGLSAEGAKLASTLRAEADFLWQRLSLFVEESKTGSESP